MEKKKSTGNKWKISKLTVFHLQAAMFGDLPAEELAALATDMEKNGLRHPIEILPDGTIICGHQRVLAAKLLRWTEIDVIILHDLAKEGPAAIEKYFIADNAERRQLSPLGRARCIKRQFELEKNHGSANLNVWQIEALKAKVAKRMNMSLRNVNRYLLVLGSPMPVQEAFDRGEVTLINAGKIARMDETVQRKIAERIKNGEDAANVVAEYLEKASRNVNAVHGEYKLLLSHLRRGVHQLNGQCHALGGRPLTLGYATLLKALALLAELIKIAESKGASAEVDRAERATHADNGESPEADEDEPSEADEGESQDADNGE